MAKMTKKELKEVLQYDRKHESFMLMPNEIIEMLSEDEELNQKDSPDVAVAYAYTYLITFMYRYAKYGVMSFEETSVKAIKKMLGLSPTNNTYDYIIKKGGVLDRLGITKTLSMTESPIHSLVSEEDNFGFPEFTLFNELEDESKEIILKGQTMKKKSFKEPLLATGTRMVMEEEYNGTFYEGGKEFTHMIPMEVFIECMTNEKLGCVGFYLYSFLQCRQGVNEMVSISLEGITKYSGIKSTTLNKYIKELKAFGLIGHVPTDFCLSRGEYKTESSVYWTKESSLWFITPNYDFKKRTVYHVSTHVDYVECSA